MSEIPPPPAPMGSVPPGYGMPQSNFAPPPRSNVFAILSLVFGLLLCIPFITNILAIIFGAVGISKSKQPGASGKGMAIAGIILGVIGIGIWSFGGWGAFQLYRMSAPMRTLGNSFVTDLAAGNIDNAVASADTTSLSRDDLKKISSDMQSWGPVKQTVITQFHMNNNELTLGGTAEFQNTTRQFELILVQVNGVWKVKDTSFK
jgi:hypothetical protein